jgi:hypothetical protein
MGFRIAVTIQTPSHRLVFVLMHDLHLIDSAVASNTRYATVDVGRVIEIYVVRQSVNTHPIDRFARPPTLMKVLEFWRPSMDSREAWGSGIALFVDSLRAMAIDARLCRWNFRVSGLVDRTVAVLAIHLQLAGVQRVAKGDRLEGTVAGVERIWTRYAQKQNARISSTCKD